MKTPLWLGALVVIGAAIAWFMSGHDTGNTTVPQAAANSDVPKTTKSIHPAASSGPALPATSEAKPDTSTEARRILGISSPAQRQLAFAQLLAATRDEAGLRAILDVFADLYQQGKRHGTEWFAFWAEMVARDPTAAAALSMSYNADPKWQADVTGIIAQEWAAKDPEAAIAWLAGNTSLSDADLDRTTLALLSGYARRDVTAATGYALSIIAQDDPLFGDMAYILSATAMQKSGPEGLFSWFDSLSNETLKNRLFPSVSNRLERVSVDVRANWLASQAAAPYRNDQVYREFVGTWAKHNPAAAMAWALGLPPSPKDGTIVGIGYAAFPWLEKDPSAFTQYYHKLDPQRQQEVVRIIQLVSNDPKMPDLKRQAGLRFLNGLK